MNPEPLFFINDIGVNGYLLAFAGGPIPVLLVLLFLGRERSLCWRRVAEAAFLGGVLALLAGLLLTFLLQEQWHDHPAELSGQWSLLYIALFAAAIWLYFRRLSATQPGAAEGLDIFFPALALYLAIVRVGCFLAGCCHGKPAWNLPWAVIVDHPMSPTIYRGIPVHPVQLYESVGNFAIFLILLAVRNRSGFRGKFGWLYFMLYGGVRFVIEFYRGDPRTMIGPLSLNQCICIAFILVSVIGWQGWAHKLRPQKQRIRSFAAMGPV